MRKTLTISFFITVSIIFTFLVFGDKIDELYYSLEGKGHAVQNKKLYLSMLYFSFLLSDIILPIPSTIIMTESANALGFFTSLFICVMGLFCSNMIGFFLCKLGLLKFEKLGSPQLDSFFKKHGFTAIILTRSIPILPELIAYMAGLSKMRPISFALASFLGAFPIALYCVYIGIIIENRTYEMFSAIGFSAAMLILSFIFKLIKK